MPSQALDLIFNHLICQFGNHADTAFSFLNVILPNMDNHNVIIEDQDNISFWILASQYYRSVVDTMSMENLALLRTPVLQVCHRLIKDLYTILMKVNPNSGVSYY